MKTDTLIFFSGRHSLKGHQRKNFLEKAIKRKPEDTKPVSDRDEEKTIIITICVALVILVTVAAHIVLFTPTQNEQFTAIYYLDSEKQLENIPKTVVLGENSTFTLWVGVENQNGTTTLFSVQVKVDNGKALVYPNPAEPIQSFEKTLVNKEIWEFPVTISIDQSGRHRLIFELWFLDETKDYFDYIGSVSLSLEAIQP